MERTVDRCKLCGAPLVGALDTPMVVCRYCEAENRVLSPTAEGFDGARVALDTQLAAEEARKLTPMIQARAAEIEPLMHAAVLRTKTAESDGERDEARGEATRLFEAYFRLHQMPGVLIARAAGPHGEQMLRDVDDATAGAVAEFASGLE